MDDIERAVDDGVNTYKQLTRDGRCLPGAGATEIELAMQLATYAEVKLIVTKRIATCKFNHDPLQAVNVFWELRV